MEEPRFTIAPDAGPSWRFPIPLPAGMREEEELELFVSLFFLAVDRGSELFKPMRIACRVEPAEGRARTASTRHMILDVTEGGLSACHARIVEHLGRRARAVREGNVVLSVDRSLVAARLGEGKRIRLTHGRSGVTYEPSIHCYETMRDPDIYDLAFRRLDKDDARVVVSSASRREASTSRCAPREDVFITIPGIRPPLEFSLVRHDDLLLLTFALQSTLWDEPTFIADRAPPNEQGMMMLANRTAMVRRLDRFVSFLWSHLHPDSPDVIPEEWIGDGHKRAIGAHMLMSAVLDQVPDRARRS